jgi:hypothetical protein
MLVAHAQAQDHRGAQTVGTREELRTRSLLCCETQGSLAFCNEITCVAPSLAMVLLTESTGQCVATERTASEPHRTL